MAKIIQYRFIEERLSDLKSQLNKEKMRLESIIHDRGANIAMNEVRALDDLIDFMKKLNNLPFNNLDQ
jgi:hypothetical protein